MTKSIKSVAAHPQAATMIKHWRSYDPVLTETLDIQRIAAPTFEEAERGLMVQRRFDTIGLQDISIDDIGNIYARTPGRDPNRPALMVSAHLDTVFPAGTDLTIRRIDNHVYGPGVGDNSLGLAALILLSAAFTQHRIQPDSDIWWVATVGEEGLGDLRGMRRVCADLNGRIGAAIILEGIGLGRIYHAGMGVRRLKINVTGPGGHSWLHAGRPSAIHHLVKLGAALVNHITPPRRPRSTLNIGLIGGGTSINTLAPEATMSIDLRSIDAGALARMESEVRGVISRFDASPDLTTSIEVVGDRPSASLSPEHPLVRAAQGALKQFNAGTGSREIGSTDANIPLSLGIPSVCIGITTGGGAHSAEEFIDLDPIPNGMRQLTLLTFAALENIELWRVWE